MKECLNFLHLISEYGFPCFPGISLFQSLKWMSSHGLCKDLSFNSIANVDIVVEML